MSTNWYVLRHTRHENYAAEESRRTELGAFIFYLMETWSESQWASKAISLNKIIFLFALVFSCACRLTERVMRWCVCVELGRCYNSGIYSDCCRWDWICWTHIIASAVISIPRRALGLVEVAYCTRNDLTSKLLIAIHQKHPGEWVTSHTSIDSLFLSSLNWHHRMSTHLLKQLLYWTQQRTMRKFIN